MKLSNPETISSSFIFRYCQMGKKLMQMPCKHIKILMISAFWDLMLCSPGGSYELVRRLFYPIIGTEELDTKTTWFNWESQSNASSASVPSLSHQLFLFPWRWRQQTPLKCWQLCARLHGVTSRQDEISRVKILLSMWALNLDIQNGGGGSYNLLWQAILTKSMFKTSQKMKALTMTITY